MEELEDIATTSSVTYLYDKDKLTYIGTSKCEYDTKGMPTTYRGQPVMVDKGNITSFNYSFHTYDGRGRRTSTSSIGGDYTFTYDSQDRLISRSDGMKFFYDDKGVAGFIYNNYVYTYRKDIFGNVIAILGEWGEYIGGYVYDAWGNHQVLDMGGNVNTDTNAIANINPFRYRSYYYDANGAYFLKTRFYDPDTGRFISPDDFSYLDPESINGLNLYVYCLNNPVMFTDETGHMPNWLKWVIGGFAFVCAVVLTVVSGGALAPVFIGMGTSILSSAIIEGLVTYANGGDFWTGFANGAADGAMWGGIFALVGATFGAIRYAVNSKGAVSGTKHLTTIKKGQIFDRYGKLSGKYITDVGTNPNMLALPGSNTGIKTTLQATKNFRAYTGIVADAFGKTGGGIQYVMRYSIDDLIKMGWLIKL